MERRICISYRKAWPTTSQKKQRCTNRNIFEHRVVRGHLLVICNFHYLSTFSLLLAFKKNHLIIKPADGDGSRLCPGSKCKNGDRTTLFLSDWRISPFISCFSFSIRQQTNNTHRKLFDKIAMLSADNQLYIKNYVKPNWYFKHQTKF